MALIRYTPPPPLPLPPPLLSSPGIFFPLYSGELHSYRQDLLTSLQTQYHDCHLLAIFVILSHLLIIHLSYFLSVLIVRHLQAFVRARGFVYCGCRLYHYLCCQSMCCAQAVYDTHCAYHRLYVLFLPTVSPGPAFYLLNAHRLGGLVVSHSSLERLFVGCLTSQQQGSVSQGRICTDNVLPHEVADQTFYLTQS